MKQPLLVPSSKFDPNPVSRCFRVAPPQGSLKAHDLSPIYEISVDELWRLWLKVTARQPRVKLLAQDAERRRTLHVQRSPIFRFPDFVRAEIIDIQPRSASIAIDSRARYGYYDFGVNRRRVGAWVALLTEAVQRASE